MKSIFKKVAGIAFAATLAFGMIGCSNGIDIHEHTFATTYTSNETHHWYAATCEHTTEVKDKTEHSFGEWTIKVQPTETAEGKKERECSVCHYEAEETVAKLEIVKTPAFSVESGEVTSGTSVTISCSTEGAKIYYTTDGSAPTSSSTEYTAAISVTEAVTIKAIAVKDGMKDSAVASASYTIKGTVATPTFSVASAEVESGTSVTISCSTEGAKIYYTKDGSEPTASSTEYTAAISVTEAVTIKAIAVKSGMNDSVVASASYTIKGTVATPAFSVAAGAVNSGTSVTISCSTEGAKIYYTTDGSEPTASSTEYTAAISVTTAITLKAIAIKSGMNDSVVASASYTIKQTVATPAFSVAAGKVTRGTSVTISCSTEGAKIYYTTDGSAPTSSSTEYTAAISVTKAVTIKAIAVKDGMNDSAVASASYTIKQTVATPAFSVAAGEVTSGTSVTISCITEGAKIYYTKDGSVPTASSTEYTAAISIAEDVTIKAIAVKNGMNDSAVASASYIIVTIPTGAYWYESPVDAVTGNAATATSTHIYFGVFPKTVLPEGSTVTINETDRVKLGANTYYKGSDNNYYAKVKENAYGTDTQYKYSDDTQAKQSSAGSYRYFKVEPIKWKVLTTNYNGKALLLAEEILTANVPYYVFSTKNRTIGGSTVYPNNYKYSTIRAYLNGAYESDDTQNKTAYNGKGFLQTAFTTTAQSKIAETVVDNRKETTGYSESTYAATYACENTTDKIFLLSESEVINSSYDFAAYNISDNARIRVTTDYAKANYAFQDSTAGCGGWWWLRSPYYNLRDFARYISDDGNANIAFYVNYTLYGVVPALSLSL